MNCERHRSEALPCGLCQLESRLPDLDHWPLETQARYLENLTETVPMTGELQGETLHIASLIRSLARKLAA